jgi:O-antigen/teichoic acid export membrane protein
MLYIAKGGFWLSLGNVVASGSSLILSIVFANYLAQDTFGTYKYVLSIVGILTISSLPGMSAALTKSVAQGFSGSLKSAFKSSIKWGLIGFTASLVVAAYYFIQGNNLLGASFLIISIFIPLKDPVGLYHSLLHGKKLFSVSTKYRIITQATTVGTLIATVFLTNNLIFILIAYFLPRVVVNGWFLVKALSRVDEKSENDPSTISYGKHLTLLKSFATIAQELDKILIWQFLGAVPVAIYSFAMAPITQIKSFLNINFSLAFPKLAQREPDKLKEIMPHKIFVFFVITVGIVIPYILLAPYLFEILFPKYMQSVLYSQVFALSLLFVPRGLLSDSLKAHAKKRSMYILSLSNSFIRIILLVLLLPFYGIWGAIWAFIASNIYHTLMSFYLFRKM